MKNVIKLLKSSVMLFGTLFVLNSCNNSESTDTTMGDSTAMNATPTPPPAPAPADAPAKLTDPEIASIAVTADQIDIDNAKIAIAKTKNKEVKAFAETMVKDHQSVNDKAVALAKKLNVTPQDNPTTQSLMAGAATTKDMLNSKTGVEFDKAYVDNEVTYHKAAIDVVENTLIPNTTNAELKSLLESALPIFKEHLAHAEMLQKSMEK